MKKVNKIKIALTSSAFASLFFIGAITPIASLIKDNLNSSINDKMAPPVDGADGETNINAFKKKDINFEILGKNVIRSLNPEFYKNGNIYLTEKQFYSIIGTYSIGSNRSLENDLSYVFSFEDLLGNKLNFSDVVKSVEIYGYYEKHVMGKISIGIKLNLNDGFYTDTRNLVIQYIDIGFLSSFQLFVSPEDLNKFKNNLVSAIQKQVDLYKWSEIELKNEIGNWLKGINVNFINEELNNFYFLLSNGEKIKASSVIDSFKVQGEWNVKNLGNGKISIIGTKSIRLNLTYGYNFNNQNYYDIELDEEFIINGEAFDTTSNYWKSYFEGIGIKYLLDSNGQLDTNSLKTFILNEIMEKSNEQFYNLVYSGMDKMSLKQKREKVWELISEESIYNLVLSFIKWRDFSLNDEVDPNWISDIKVERFSDGSPKIWWDGDKSGYLPPLYPTHGGTNVDGTWYPFWQVDSYSQKLTGEHKGNRYSYDNIGFEIQNSIHTVNISIRVTFKNNLKNKIETITFNKNGHHIIGTASMWVPNIYIDYYHKLNFSYFKDWINL